jgi:hypothetical protein
VFRASRSFFPNALTKEQPPQCEADDELDTSVSRLSPYGVMRMTVGRIQWVGESERWVVPAHERSPQYIMALTEDAVLDVATMRSSARKLSLPAALDCTSRLPLRVALSRTGLKPEWHPLEWPGSSVVKAPASCASLGVRFLPGNGYIRALKRVARGAGPSLASCWPAIDHGHQSGLVPLLELGQPLSGPTLPLVRRTP